MSIISKAIIPAAGLGTRFLPITKGIPKEMLAIVDKPAIQYIVEEAVNSGITDVLIIVSEGKDPIINYFSNGGRYESLKENPLLDSVNNLLDKASFHFVNQTVLNGNGAAVALAKDFVGNEPFAVLFGDDIVYSPQSPVLSQLITAYEKVGKIIVGCQRRPKEEAVKYGVVSPKSIDGRYVEMKDIVEKPKAEDLPSDICSLGRFILTPEIFDALEKCPKLNGEIYLTEAIRYLIPSQGAYAYEFEGERYDIGDKLGYIEANIAFGLRNEIYRDKLKKFLND